MIHLLGLILLNNNITIIVVIIIYIIYFWFIAAISNVYNHNIKIATNKTLENIKANVIKINIVYFEKKFLLI